MASPAINIAIILKALDQTGPGYNSAVNKGLSAMERMQKASKSYMTSGAVTGAAGAALVASLKPAYDAFSELEQAQADLESRMMRSGGQLDASAMAAMNAEAIRLGNVLPGTTADISNMFTVMLDNNIANDRILNGLGEATAYFAINTKMGFGDAAQYVARLSDKMNIADKDAMKFLDTINRSKQLGINVDEMGYAFSRSAGSLKLLKLQGIDAFNQMAPIMSQLIKNLGSGETAGTSISKVFAAFSNAKKMKDANLELAQFGIRMNMFDSQGGFVGIESMLEQLGQLDKLNAAQKKGFINAITGGEGQDVGALVTLLDLAANKGKDYIKISNQMAEKASLTEQVQRQLQTTKNLAEAAGGTWTNLMATFGASMSEELHKSLKLFNDIASSLQTFASQNPKITKMIGLMIGGAGVGLGLVGAFTLVKGAILAMNLAFLANPMVLGIAAILAAGVALYTYWDEISDFYVKWWKTIGLVFEFGVRTVLAILNPLIKAIKLLLMHDLSSWNEFKDSVTNYIPNIENNIGGVFNKGVDTWMPQQSTMAPSRVASNQLSFAPNFIFNGPASKEDVKSALGMGQRDFERYSKQLEHDKKRKSYMAQ